MDAADRSAVVEKLRDQGNFPLSVDFGVARSQSILHRDLFGAKRVATRELVTMTRELATLLEAGLPLDRALSILIDVAESQEALQKLLSRVLQHIEGGASFASAIEQESDAFPRYYVGMVKAGEAGGALHQVLARLADFMERMKALRDSAVSAMIYPAIVLTMAIVTIVIMFVFVLPEFRTLFEEQGDNLPLLTQAFLATGDFIGAWWWADLAGIGLVAFVFAWRLRNPAFRLRWDRFRLSVPLFGDLARKVETARFAHTLAMLLRGGQPLLEALGIVREVLDNSALRAALVDVAGRLRQGQGLSGPLAASGMFPALATNLIRVGEEGGQLEQMLEGLATTYDREVRESTQRLLALLVPLITIVLGGLIVLIILSVLLGILSVNELVL